MKKNFSRYFKTTNKEGRWFNQWLVFLNIIFIGVLFFEFLYESNIYIKVLEIILGVIFAVELLGRFLIDKQKKTFFFRGLNFIDLVVIISVFGKYFVLSTLWLQVISGFRVFRVYHILEDLSSKSKKIFNYNEVIKALLSLIIFVFIVSELVLQILGPKNEGINNFIDALYFTVTTLTTTGFGDITVKDSIDKLLVIFIMVVGVTLFLQLMQNIFRRRKVFFRCKHCGLTHHDLDAIHCKHCGKTVNIKTKGN